MVSKAKRVIGIDYGMARLGLSYSDESKLIAMPWMVLGAEKKTEKTVAKFLRELERNQKEKAYEAEAIVVGMPLLMSGKVGFLADEVKHFIEFLKQATTIPIVSWDERLTSVQAERALRESSLTRKRRAQYVDTVAAVIILQNYLDSIKLG
ncbi:MAG: Holliday junction resolvase RuvX [Parachlamydia sp.]|nr:Holliday junction resolvase RuvX [Parachlamydia sp.]